MPEVRYCDGVQMKLYVVFREHDMGRGDVSWSEVCGIYQSREKANARIQALVEGPTRVYPVDLSIVECDLDEDWDL